MRIAHHKFEVASNPHGNRSGSEAHAARKKGKHMAHAKNASKTAANHKSKRPNPFKKKFEEMKKRHNAKSHKKRNPSMAETIGRPTDLVVTGLSALASAVATKQLPQMILSTSNTGWEGYLANAVTTVAATWAAGTFIGTKAAQGALAGGLVIILDRILTDQFSSVGPYLALSGVGDATSYGKLGTIREGYYFHPTLLDANGNLITPDPVLQQAVSAVVAAYPQIAAPLQTVMTQGKMGAANPSALRTHMASGALLSSRFQSRFNR